MRKAGAHVSEGDALKAIVPGEDSDLGAGARSGPKLERLLTAAAGLMARQGYDQTSIRDVARETGFSLAGMYYYFQSKEDLLFRIQDRTFRSLLEEQERAMAEGGSAVERLRRLVHNHLSYYTQHFNEMKVCTFELHSLSDERYRAIEALRRRYFRLSAGVIGEIVSGESGVAEERVVRHYTLFLFGMLNWIFMWFDPQRDAPVETLGGEIINMALHGLLGDRSAAE